MTAGPSALRRNRARRSSGRALWAIAVHRLGRRILTRGGPARRLLLPPYHLLVRATETFTKISLPVFTPIGDGMKIVSCGMIFIHSDAVIGRNCTLGHGVTIGSAHEGDGAPVIGDNVEIGAYAQILGGVHIGDGAKIAPMSVVLIDVPAGGVASGIPARLR